MTRDKILLLQKFSIQILFFSIPFSNNYSNVALALLLISNVAACLIKGHFHLKVFWFLPTMFAYFLISSLLTGGSLPDLEKRFLLLIPLVISFGKLDNDERLRTRVYLSFIFANITAILFCLGRAILRSFSWSNGHLIFNPKVDQAEKLDFMMSSIMGGNYFFGDELSYFHHPTYFGLFLVFAQYLVYVQLKLTSSRCPQLLLGLSYCIFLLVIFLLSSKAVILTSLALSFYLIIDSTFSKKAKIISIGFFIICVIFMTSNPRLRVFYETFKSSNIINPNAKYGYELRILSWDAALTVIKENLVWGVGENNKAMALIEAYKRKGYVYPAQFEHNSHNQYLDFLIGGGLFAFGIFIVGLIQLGVIVVRRKDYVLGVFLLIFSFIALFENLLSRYAGLLFFSLVIGFLTAHQKSNSPLFVTETKQD